MQMFARILNDVLSDKFACVVVQLHARRSTREENGPDFTSRESIPESWGVGGLLQLLIFCAVFQRLWCPTPVLYFSHPYL